MTELRVQDLSPDQRTAYDTVLKWIREAPSYKQCLWLGGYAGTGKSSLLGLLAKEQIGRMAFVAFTGKASSVLRKKLAESGVATRGRLRKDRHGQPWPDQDANATFVGTIHSLCYLPVEDIETGRVTGFGKQEGLDQDYKLLVIDEASMVSDDVLDHLKSYGVPILLVGDHGQLPPVRGSSSAMMHPDVRLEKIHRQAEGNPILRLSAEIRETGDLPSSFASKDERIRLLKNNQLRDVLDSYEGMGPPELRSRALIVYTNRNRILFNSAIRGRLDRPGPTPVTGDQVVCLKNIQRRPVYNGMRGFLATLNPGIQPWQVRAQVEFPDDETNAMLDVSIVQFGREKTFEDFDQAQEAIVRTGAEVGKKIDTWAAVGSLFDYGYCVTGHKMQGSQVEEAIVMCERPMSVSNDGWSRWLYTCVTRASERLTILAA